MHTLYLEYKHFAFREMLGKITTDKSACVISDCCIVVKVSVVKKIA